MPEVYAAGGFQVPEELLRDVMMHPPLWTYLLPPKERQVALLRYGFGSTIGSDEVSAVEAEGLERGVRWDEPRWLTYLRWEPDDNWSPPNYAHLLDWLHTAMICRGKDPRVVFVGGKSAYALRECDHYHDGRPSVAGWQLLDELEELL